MFDQQTIFHWGRWASNVAWGGMSSIGGVWVGSIYTSNVALGHAFDWSIFRWALAMLEMLAVVMIHWFPDGLMMFNVRGWYIYIYIEWDSKCLWRVGWSSVWSTKEWIIFHMMYLRLLNDHNRLQVSVKLLLTGDDHVLEGSWIKLSQLFRVSSTKKTSKSMAHIPMICISKALFKSPGQRFPLFGKKKGREVDFPRADFSGHNWKYMISVHI